MKIGVFTVSMPEYTVFETVEILKELGYDGVEWRVGSQAPERKPENYSYEQRYWSYNLSTVDVKRIGEDALEIKKICEKAGLEVYSLTTYLEPVDLEQIEDVAKAANVLGCKNMRVNVPKYDEQKNYRKVFAQAVNDVKEVEKIAVRYEVRINFEIHMGNIIPSASAAYRLVSCFDPRYIGIIYDPGNMVHEGFENYRLGLELLGEYLACVHIKNAAWTLSETRDNGMQIWKPVWAPLNKGYGNIEKLIGVLKDIGYNGYLSIEDFSNEEDTLTKLKNNLVLLKNFLR